MNIDQLENRLRSLDAPGAATGPGEEYWASVVPRLRRRINAGRRGAAARFGPSVVRVVMPAAAAVVITLVLEVAAVRTPNTAMPLGLSSLSAAELQELRLSGTRSGLLEPVESNGAAEGSIAEFLTDLLSEEGQAALFAVSEPEELLRHLGEEQYAEIVNILESR